MRKIYDTIEGLKEQKGIVFSGRVVYSFLLAAYVTDVLVFALTAWKTPPHNIFRSWGLYAGNIYLLAFFLVLAIALEFLQSRWKAVICALIVIVVHRVDMTYTNTILMKSIALALLSNLGTKKWNAATVLAANLAYFVLLIIVNQKGLVNIFITPPKLQLLGRYLQGSSFGTAHPNTMGILLASTVLIVWYLVRPAHIWLNFLILWSGAMLVLLLTVSRSSVILLALVPVLDVVIKWLFRNPKKWKCILTASVPWVILLCSMIMSMMIINGKLPKIGFSFAERFLDFRYIVTDYHSLFGSHYEEETVFYSVEAFPKLAEIYPSGLGVRAELDNVYYYLIINCGLVPTALTLSLLSWMLYRLATQKEYALLAAATAFLAYGLMETAALYVNFFFVPLLAFVEERTTSRKKMIGLKTELKSGRLEENCDAEEHSGYNIIRKEG